MKASNLGLDGNDPVEYVARSRLVAGNPQFKAKHRDSTFCFTSANNLELFNANPERYVPQLDGNCVFSYAFYGEAVRVPATYSAVVGGRIYLFAGPWYRFFCKLWPGFYKSAHANYNQVHRR